MFPALNNKKYMYKDVLKKKVMYLLLSLFHLGKFMFPILTNTCIIMVNY